MFLVACPFKMFANKLTESSWLFTNTNFEDGDENISQFVNWIDYLAIALYFVIIIFVGIWVKLKTLFLFSI